MVGQKGKRCHDRRARRDRNWKSAGLHLREMAPAVPQSGSTSVIQRDTIQTAKLVTSINQGSGLQPLAVKKMPIDVPPPKRPGLARRSSSRVFHWVRPELVVEVKFLIWTQDGLRRQVIYHGLRVDKPAKKVRRPTPRQ